MLWWQERSKINTWRQNKLKLPPFSGPLPVIMGQKLDIICAFDKYTIPWTKVPKDWKEEWRVVGYFFVPVTPDDQIDPELAKWISNGEPPICVGFGSMPAPDPKAMLNILIKAAQKVKRRVIILSGATEYEGEELPKEEVLIIKSAPHDWLLPKCCCVVHHCGVGTSAAVLRSGVPSVPIPFYLDQPHNAHLLTNLGVASPAIKFQTITDVKVAQAIEMVINSKEIQAKAKEVAQELKTDGVQQAIKILENVMAKSVTF